MKQKTRSAGQWKKGRKVWRGKRGKRMDGRKGETEKKERKCGVVLKGVGVPPQKKKKKNVLLWISVSKLCGVGLYVGYVTQRGQVAFSVAGSGGINTA